MTPEQVRDIQRSWAAVVPIAGTAADLFYDRLFDLDPSLRALFPADLSGQKKKLMDMLHWIVVGLDELPKLVPAVRELGARHRGYGVAPQHYETVGAALLWTLERGLGELFTPEVERAWTEAYRVLAEAMQAGPEAHARAS
jgi:hemoglobin-like flavoprotein